jgi:hypothetical protein
MSQGDRNNLLNEIEELRSSIDKLQPETYAPEIDGQDNIRKQLKALRKDLRARYGAAAREPEI